MSFFCSDPDPMKCSCTLHRAARRNREADELPSMTLYCPGCGATSKDAISPPGSGWPAEMMARAIVQFAERHAEHCK